MVPDAAAMWLKFVERARPVVKAGAEKFSGAIGSWERYVRVSTATALGRWAAFFHPSRLGRVRRAAQGEGPRPYR